MRDDDPVQFILYLALFAVTLAIVILALAPVFVP